MKFSLAVLAGSMIAGLLCGVALHDAPPRQVASPPMSQWKPRNTIGRTPVMSADDLDKQQPNAAAFVHSAPQPAGAAITRSANYRNCGEAWAAGAAPIHVGQPGYAAHMDGDHDGVACEPIRR